MGDFRCGGSHRKHEDKKALCFPSGVTFVDGQAVRSGSSAPKEVGKLIQYLGIRWLGEGVVRRGQQETSRLVWLGPRPGWREKAPAVNGFPSVLWLEGASLSPECSGGGPSGQPQVSTQHASPTWCSQGLFPHLYPPRLQPGSHMDMYCPAAPRPPPWPLPADSKGLNCGPPFSLWATTLASTPLFSHLSDGNVSQRYCED